MKTPIDRKIKALKKKLETVKGTPCSVYTRIVGYYRAIKNWNIGQREQYNDRREFIIKDIEKKKRT